MFMPILPLLISSIFVLGLANKPMSEASFSLNNRYPDSFVNTVFKDNILLNLAYLRGQVQNSQKIDWKEIEKPFDYSFELKPGEVFAFHQDVLPEFKSAKIKTTNAHFNFQEGFKTDGYLYGDGVCHFASLLYKASLWAGLKAYAPANHDFREIPEIEREYGVSIYFMPGSSDANAHQNLYITNNQKNIVTFNISYKNDILKVWITGENQLAGLDLSGIGRF